ncbi:phosphoribosylaminoimidazole-succinocarboxamide synthase [Thermococcus kodakarensis KOD1]|uniref:Phosphoribosylaminoimidazole-succinocarboxamide synthase n=1 Tax=Thermococcus kodakarensis (strain ATCC BAA-918 / JCM 12380 / KOD1) TaxID=69014 RepID=PUR7_THEKO|nr:phosphoribosylaminoimidazolesuccinocarboxamide synthase [Thermococcus kodakarensis]Q5JFN5.1 RecName: Full=Phosphoribosylaminoimidazole-succinocarboxamide synthase; AltName: Full=SAICAR synthetase [Thermococcus kodakarensis KOD1]WCN29154.1 phosphoribosylaminoimidazolesuccinocarboxamide synthase [Thermococcus kodakarensis]WCN31460.1 phosphoribosylaminoimidazolesuccinocarboxamide synthase [Thermococcus kodakarensis]BAD84399.1 phosphoribosylaminoimidazole-succinocarboxamide synthase [Thermococcu
MDVYEGKAKKIIPLDDGKVIMEFKDDATAFNGEKKAQFRGKGWLNAQISAHLFRVLEASGIKTHFIGVAGDNRLIVERLKMYPLEVVVRNVVAGSLKKRLPLEEGTELPEPIIEFYYKNDDLGDPMINQYHARVLGVGESELKEMEKIALQVNDVLRKYFAERGIILVDFKLEFGKNTRGEIVLGDEISPDTCRFWDAETKESLDKDVFRFGKGDLISAYERLYERITGEAPVRR